jgi:hypothetical protein
VAGLRAANIVVQLAASAARDTLLRTGQQNHPQRDEAAKALGSAAGTDLQMLRQVLAAMPEQHNEDAQLEFNLGTAFAGLSSMLGSDPGETSNPK